MLTYWMFSFSFFFSFLFFRGLCFSSVDVFFESFFFNATSFQQPYENMKFFVIKSCDLFLVSCFYRVIQNGSLLNG